MNKTQARLKITWDIIYAMKYFNKLKFNTVQLDNIWEIIWELHVK